MCCVIAAISFMNSLRDISPRSMRASFHSHSPVSSGAVSSGMPSPLSRVISEKALAVGCKLAAFAVQILFGDQVLDDLGTRSRRAETASGHRCPQFLVVHCLCRHPPWRSVAAGFRIAGRRLGLVRT
jgi:hypothetical protein